jgi:hypothetical protein
VTGLAVPWITQQWSEQRRIAEVKAKLISDAARSVATILAAAQLSEFGGAPGAKTRTLQAWEVEHVVVSSRMRAYLVDATIATDWDHLGRMLRFAYAGGVHNARRLEYIAQLREYLDGSQVNWRALQDGYSNENQFREYNGAWFQLKQALLDRYAAIAQRILAGASR